MAQSIKTNQYYNARVVLLDQLKKQGYDVSKYESFGINEIHSMLQTSTLDMLMENESRKVYVHYFTGKSFKLKDIRETMDELFTNQLTKNDSVIFVTQDEGNDTIKENVKQIWEEEQIFIILLCIKKLQFNVLEHSLVPLHEIITSKEVEEIMNKYKMKDISLFPEISRFDAVALSIGMRPGEICRISRPSKTAIISYYYRLCVNK
jgi:DNA-directed RNA polymerase subunit H (RpoH/RPB5)